MPDPLLEAAFNGVTRLWRRLATLLAYPWLAAGWRVEAYDRCTSHSGWLIAYDRKGRPIDHVRAQVVEWRNLPVEVYVLDPPKRLRQHPKGHCFQLVDPERSVFLLHFERPPQDFQAARAYLEQMWSEACSNELSRQ